MKGGLFLISVFLVVAFSASVSAVCGDGILDVGELCDHNATDSENNPYGEECSVSCWVNGKAPFWQACRGSGVHVCIDHPDVTDQYFTDNPGCIPNPTCSGSFFSCNSVICPQALSTGNGTNQSNETGLDLIYPVPFIIGDSVDAAIVFGTEPLTSAVEIVHAGGIEADLRLMGADSAGPFLVSDDDLEQSDSRNKNLIVVGTVSNGHSNSIASQIIRDDRNLQEGQFLIESYVNPFQSGKIALLVLGYSLEELLETRDFLRIQRIFTSPGSAYFGNVEISNGGNETNQTNGSGNNESNQTNTTIITPGDEIGNETNQTNGTVVVSGNGTNQTNGSGNDTGNQTGNLTDNGLGQNNCQGCFEEDKCFPLGFRKSGEFCSINLDFVSQFGEGAVCENNFECGSNVCVSGECVEVSLIQKILDFFRRIFG